MKNGGSERGRFMKLAVLVALKSTGAGNIQQSGRPGPGGDRERRVPALPPSGARDPAALALYRELGFIERYGYHYRLLSAPRKPPSSPDSTHVRVIRDADV